MNRAQLALGVLALLYVSASANRGSKRFRAVSLSNAVGECVVFPERGAAIHCTSCRFSLEPSWQTERVFLRRCAAYVASARAACQHSSDETDVGFARGAAPIVCAAGWNHTVTALSLRGGNSDEEPEVEQERGAVMSPSDGKARKGSTEEEINGEHEDGPLDIDVTAGGSLGLTGEQLSLLRKMERAQLRQRAGILPSASARRSALTPVGTQARRQGPNPSSAGTALRQVDDTLQEALQQIDDDFDDLSSWMSDEHEGVRTAGAPSASGQNRFDRQDQNPGGMEAPQTADGRSRLPLDDGHAEARIEAALGRLASPLAAPRIAPTPRHQRQDFASRRNTSRHDGRPPGVEEEENGRESFLYRGDGMVGKWWERFGDAGLNAFMTNPELSEQQEQLTNLMKDLDLNDGRDSASGVLDEEDQAFCDAFDLWHRNVTDSLRASEAYYDNISVLAGGDHGTQFDPPGAPGQVRALFVGGQGFESVSEAVDVACKGQVIYVEAGSHPVGNALMLLGLDSECLPVHRHETLVVSEGWCFHLLACASPALRVSQESRGHVQANTASQIVGSFLLDSGSEGSFNGVALTHRGQKGQGRSILPRGDQIGEVALLHVFGSWTYSGCSISFGGGHGIGLLCDGAASVCLNRSSVGGLDVSNGSVDSGRSNQVAREVRKVQDCRGMRPSVFSGPQSFQDEERLAAREARDADKGALVEAIRDGTEDRCANAVAAVSESTLSIHESTVWHAWNAGVSLLDKARATLSATSICHVGFGVGINDKVSVSIVDCVINASVSSAMLTGALYVSETSQNSSLQIFDTEINGLLWLGLRRPTYLKMRAASGSHWQDDVCTNEDAATQLGVADAVPVSSAGWRQALLARMQQEQEADDAHTRLLHLVDEMDKEIRAHAATASEEHAHEVSSS